MGVRVTEKWLMTARLGGNDRLPSKNVTPKARGGDLELKAICGMPTNMCSSIMALARLECRAPSARAEFMNAISMAVLFALLVFAAGCVGLELQRRLPESYTTGSARDTIGAVSGLLGLFLALVLGLLIWTSYGVYSTQKLSLQTLAFNVFKFDAALKEYGPETNDLRRAVKEGVNRAIVET
jgi:hypothetical protein